MKRKLTAFSLIAASLSLGVFFSSCHQAIFSSINAEVALEKNGLNGDINSIVYHGDYIYAANGAVYCKTNQPSSYTGLDNGQWTLATSPDVSEFYDSSDTSADLPGEVTFLASDDTYLYASVIVWHESNNGYNEAYSRKIFCAPVAANGTSLNWEEVDVSSIVGDTKDTATATVKSVFDNKYVKVSYTDGKASYDLSKRNAYARIYCESDSAYHVYSLDGPNVPAPVPDDTNGAGEETCSAVYYKGEDYFSSYYAFAANDDYIYYAKTFTTSGLGLTSTVSASSTLYYANQWDSEKGYTLSGTETSDTSASDLGNIYSISLAKDFILVGSSSGLKRVELADDGIPKDRYTFSSSLSSNNGDSIISCYVFTTFILDPERNEGDPTAANGTDEYACSTIYGSITSSSDSFSDTGLYAFYPSRGTWNRDGTSNDANSGN